MRIVAALGGLIVLLASAEAQAADWKAVEQVKTYAVSGTSGPELYASIGERGPAASIGRAIAHTNFKLTWTRDYQTRGSDCVLATARPKLTITYTLPKASQKLPPAIKRNWEVFEAGVAAHERVHGDFIKDMVREIESATVGLTMADDPGCKKIRAHMTDMLSGISLAQRRKSSEFDRVELSNGGNVHQLILNLVNGG